MKTFGSTLKYAVGESLFMGFVCYLILITVLFVDGSREVSDLFETYAHHAAMIALFAAISLPFPLLSIRHQVEIDRDELRILHSKELKVKVPLKNIVGMTQHSKAPYYRINRTDGLPIDVPPMRAFHILKLKRYLNSLVA